MHIRAYLQLVRLPAVFTAMADIFLGFLLTHDSLGERPPMFVLLLAASSCLYMAGMVFNDVFDREVDARERPDRPIPSGQVPLRAAVLFGGGLVLLGLIAAGLAGLPSLIVAGLLTLCIFAYDGLLKPTPLGPVAMGGCRFLNIILGASAATGTLAGAFAMPQIQVAAGMGIYILGVTWFARQEAGRSNSKQLLAAMVVVNLGMAVLLGFVAYWEEGQRQAMGVMMALVIFMLIINRRMAAALFRPVPELVQPAVRVMLMTVIIIDATLIYFHLGPDGAVYALATVALLLPASFLGRWLYMT